MAVDPSAASSVMDALKVGGAGVLGAVLAAFAKNFFTSAGTDAREFRTEYREEIKRLKEQGVKDREDIEELRDDVSMLRLTLGTLHAQRDRARMERDSLRLHQNAEERGRGVALTVWPPDPPDPVSPP